MAEEQTSPTTPQAPSETASAPSGGQAAEQAPVERAEPQPQSGTETASQPTKAVDKPKQKTNLFQDPEFRKYQAQMTRNQQALQQQLQQAQQEMKQLRQSGMTDDQKKDAMIDELQAEIQGYQQQQQQNAENERILNDMRLVHDKTGVPLEDLYSSTSFEDAWDIGIAYLKDQGAAKVEQDEAQRAANKVVHGGGGTSTPTDRATKKVEDAYKSGDVRAFMRELRLSRQKDTS